MSEHIYKLELSSSSSVSSFVSSYSSYSSSFSSKSSISSISSSSSPLSIAEGLVGHWMLNENLEDNSNYEVALSLVDGGYDAFFDTGVLDQSYRFVTGNHLLIGDRDNYQNPVHLSFEKNDSWTVALWMKINGEAGYEGFSHLYSKDGWFISLHSGSSYLYSDVQNTNPSIYVGAMPNGNIPLGYQSTSFYIRVKEKNHYLNDNNWHHIGVSYDGSELAQGFKIYIDGQESETVTHMDNLTGAPQTSLINYSYSGMLGGRNNIQGSTEDYVFDGNLDDILVWNRVLELNEIRHAYGRGYGRSIYESSQSSYSSSKSSSSSSISSSSSSSSESSSSSSESSSSSSISSISSSISSSSSSYSSSSISSSKSSSSSSISSSSSSISSSSSNSSSSSSISSSSSESSSSSSISSSSSSISSSSSSMSSSSSSVSSSSSSSFSSSSSSQSSSSSSKSSNSSSSSADDFNYYTKLLIQNGCVYEFGLIKKATSEEEDKEIINSHTILETSLKNQMGFLFKFSEKKSDSIILDKINGYTGVINGYDKGSWI